MAEKNIFSATGRRKEATARVRLVSGEGKIIVNQKPMEEYFGGIERLKIIIKKPLEITQNLGRYDVFANAKGGGISAQAGAISLGVARALIKTDEKLRKILRPAGFLTRDPREKERKKYGRKRARKRFQFTKR